MIKIRLVALLWAVTTVLLPAIQATMYGQGGAITSNKGTFEFNCPQEDASDQSLRMVQEVFPIGAEHPNCEYMQVLMEYMSTDTVVNIYGRSDMDNVETCGRRFDSMTPFDPVTVDGGLIAVIVKSTCSAGEQVLRFSWHCLSNSSMNEPYDVGVSFTNNDQGMVEHTDFGPREEYMTAITSGRQVCFKVETSLAPAFPGYDPCNSSSVAVHQISEDNCLDLLQWLCAKSGKFQLEDIPANVLVYQKFNRDCGGSMADYTRYTWNMGRCQDDCQPSPYEPTSPSTTSASTTTTTTTPTTTTTTPTTTTTTTIPTTTTPTTTTTTTTPTTTTPTTTTTTTTPTTTTPTTTTTTTTTPTTTTTTTTPTTTTPTTTTPTTTTPTTTTPTTTTPTTTTPTTTTTTTTPTTTTPTTTTTTTTPTTTTTTTPTTTTPTTTTTTTTPTTTTPTTTTTTTTPTTTTTTPTTTTERPTIVVKDVCGGAFDVPYGSNLRIDYKSDGMYANNEICLWLIRTINASRATIVYSSQSFERYYDGCRILDYNPDKPDIDCFKYDNDYEIPRLTYSPFALFFSSDYSVTYRGFTVEIIPDYDYVPEDREFPFDVTTYWTNAPSGDISFPNNYGQANYPSNSRWLAARQPTPGAPTTWYWWVNVTLEEYYDCVGPVRIPSYSSFSSCERLTKICQSLSGGSLPRWSSTDAMVFYAWSDYSYEYAGALASFGPTQPAAEPASRNGMLTAGSMPVKLLESRKKPPRSSLISSTGGKNVTL